jgi:polyisoprenoid-binding protein YceI
MNMKKSIFLAFTAFAFVMVSFKADNTTTWTYDSNHAKLGFSVTHMMISDVEGYFKKANVTLTTTKNDFTDAVVEVKADAASVFTDNESRDNHLLTADFFDVAKFPEVVFKSTYFKPTKVANTYMVKGMLTMHGVTKPVTLTAVARTGVNPMNKKNIAGFKITGKVKRLDFGIGSGSPTAIISDEVLINANAEFSKD